MVRFFGIHILMAYNKALILSYGLPIVNNSKPIGLIIADVNLTSIQEFLESIEGTTQRSFSAILSDMGTVIAHSLGNDLLLTNVIEKSRNLSNTLICPKWKRKYF